MWTLTSKSVLELSPALSCPLWFIRVGSKIVKGKTEEKETKEEGRTKDVGQFIYGSIFPKIRGHLTVIIMVLKRVYKCLCLQGQLDLITRASIFFH